MSDFRLVRAILEHSWTKARTLVAEHPHLVYVGSFSRCDYIQLQDEGNNNNNNQGDNHDDNSSAGLLQRRGALHELCRIFDTLNDEDDSTEDIHSDNDEEDLGESSRQAERQQILQLAREIIQASHVHCSFNRQDKNHRKEEYSLEKSILLLYEGDQTPLHILFSRNINMPMITILMESIANPELRNQATIQIPTVEELLSNQNSLGVTPLHYLANCRSCPAASLKQILNYHTQQQQQQSTTEAISTSMSLQRAMCLEDNDDLENPLHWAMSAEVSPVQLGILLEHGGSAAFWKPNLQGDFPMDVFSNGCQQDLSICEDAEIASAKARTLKKFKEYLAVVMAHSNNNNKKKNPTDSSYPQQRKWLPLHELVSSICFPCPSYMFDLALHEHGDDVLEYNDDGLQPLHLALLAPRQQQHQSRQEGGILHNQASNHKDDAVVQQHAATRNNHVIRGILSYSERSAQMACRRDGRLPLHYAVEANNLDWDVIQELVRQHPGALSLPDPKTGLHPFALASVDDNASLEVVFELLKLCPSVLESRVDQ